MSIWEIAIKEAQRKASFTAQSDVVLSELLSLGFVGLGLTSLHAIATTSLPHLHEDPFDRVLIAQAFAEQLTLVTADKKVAAYPSPILKV